MRFRVVILTMALLIVGCGEDKPKKPDSAKSDAKTGSEQTADGAKKKRDNRVPIEAALISRGPIEDHIRSSANLDTESSVKVLSRTTNLVAELMVEEGDIVKKGQVLARLENESQRIALEKAQSTYERNTEEFERQKHLIARNLVSDKGFAETTYQHRQSKLDRDNAQLNYDFTIIRAPISGTVTQRLINLGDQVNNNKHLFDIVDFETMVARIFLPEEHLQALKVGQRARVYSQSLPGRNFDGEVLRISPIVDARSGTVKVTVAMNAQGYLRPGMYVDVSIITDRRPNAVLVPKKALTYDDERAFVYLIKDGKANRIAIDPEIIDIEYFKPRSGLEAGDVVAIAGINGLKDQARVRVVNEDTLADKQNASLDNVAAAAEAVQSEGVSEVSSAAEGEPNVKDMTREERRAHMQERMKNMTEEERKAFIEQRKKRRAEQKGGKDAA